MRAVCSFGHAAAKTGCRRGEPVKLSTWMAALVGGLAVTVALFTDTWLYLAIGVAGVTFVLFAFAHPRLALLAWLLLAPAATEYANLSLPAGIPDLTFSRLVVAVVVLAVGVRMIVKGRRLVPFGTIELVMLALLAVAVFDMLRSGRVTSDALQIFDEYMTPVLLFLAARNVCVRRVDLRHAAYILAAVGCYLALHGGYQYFFYQKTPDELAVEDLMIQEGGQRVNESHLAEGRAVGPFSSAVEYGSVSAIAFLAALFLVLYRTHGPGRVLLAATLPAIAAAVVMSSTRSVWLGAWVGAVALALLDTRRRIALLASILAITAAGVIVAALLLPRSSELEDRASSMEPIEARLVMYKIGLTIAVRHPLTGYGRGSPSRIAARRELYASGDPNADLAPGQFHNVFLMTLVEWGLVGLAAYCAVLVMMARGALHLRRLVPEQDLAHQFAGLFLATVVVFVVQGLLVDTPPFLCLNGMVFFLGGLVHAQLDARLRPVVAEAPMPAITLPAGREASRA